MPDFGVENVNSLATWVQHRVRALPAPMGRAALSSTGRKLSWPFNQIEYLVPFFLHADNLPSLESSLSSLEAKLISEGHRLLFLYPFEKISPFHEPSARSLQKSRIEISCIISNFFIADFNIKLSNYIKIKVPLSLPFKSNILVLIYYYFKHTVYPIFQQSAGGERVKSISVL